MIIYVLILTNIGDLYLDQRKFDQAISYYKDALSRSRPVFGKSKNCGIVADDVMKRFENHRLFDVSDILKYESRMSNRKLKRLQNLIQSVKCEKSK